MDYEHLTPEQQRAIVSRRVATLEAEHYGHTLALATAKALDEPQQVSECEQNLTVIETAITTARTELAKLPKPKPDDAPETHPRRRVPKDGK